MSSGTHVKGRSQAMWRVGMALILFLTLVSGALVNVGSVRAAIITVDSAADTVAADAQCTLREAIDSANADADVNDCEDGTGNDTITINAAVGTIVLALSLPQVTDADGLTIVGNSVTVDGDDTFRIFDISTSGAVTIESLTIADGDAGAGADGGGILKQNSGPLTLTNVILSSNEAGDDGAGLFNGGSGLVTITGGAFTNNIATGSASPDGGGINNNSSSARMVVNGTTFASNAARNGAGISNADGAELAVTGATFTTNTATNGGGLYNNNSTANEVTVASTTFSGNSASVGGGIFNSGELALTGGTVSGNTANDGGGIYNEDELVVAGTTISGNSASNDGGGIANVGQLGVTGATFTGNTAADDGGGIYTPLSFGDLSVTGSTFTGNIATNGEGGAIYFGPTTGELTVATSTFAGNSANVGGAIWNDDGGSTVDTSTFDGNSTDGGDGGAIYDADGMDVTRSYFTDNSAVGSGGAIAATGGLVAANNTFTGNSATPNGGAIAGLGGNNDVRFSTFVENVATGAGSAIAATAGNVNVYANLIVDDTVAEVGVGTVTSQGYNVTDITSLPLDNPTDVDDNDAGRVSGPDDHGGPTQTYRLLAGNPALDLVPLFGDACTAPTDQRGILRPQGNGCDAGAFEVANQGTPTITAISPTGATAGDPATPLTVNGTNFAADGFAVVNFCGTDLATTFVSSTQLTATIPAAQLATARQCPVTVRNTGPGGGISNPLNFTISAPAAPSPVASASPSALAFGNQTVGTTSAAQPVTLTNTGGAPLAINVITISGDFAQTNTCPASLPASASCTINVTFTPVVAAARNGNLTIFTDADNSPINVILSGVGVAPPSPSPTPITYTVTVSTIGPGTVSPGTSTYEEGTVASFAATPSGSGNVFLGWTLDGQYAGFAPTLDFTVEGNRSLVARFAARPTFSDVPQGDADYQAITFLAALGIVNPAGVNNSGRFEPGREVARAEVAAFVARVFGWQREFHANTFPDRCDPSGANCVDDELWNNVAALKDYGVVGGYTDPATCQAAGTTAPCYLPRDPVKRVQVASIVARAFIKNPDLRSTGFWDRLDANATQYTNVPDEGTQRSDLTTFRANAGPVPGQVSDGTFPNPEGAASRRFVIQVLYQAFASQYGVDRAP